VDKWLWAARFFHATAHAGTGGAELVAGGVLQVEHAEVEGDGVEPAAEDDAGPARLRGLLVGGDHVAHPQRLAAEVDVIVTPLCAGGHEVTAVELVGPDGADDAARPRGHGVEAGRVARIRNDQRRVRRRADLVAHGGELVGIAPGHGPGKAVAALLCEVLGDEAAGKAGGAVDDDVEVPLLFHAWLR